MPTRLHGMKIRWGNCKHACRHIRFNTTLDKKPSHPLKYVLVHELARLIATSHDEKYIDLLNAYVPMWREARVELNALPLAVG